MTTDRRRKKFYYYFLPGVAILVGLLCFWIVRHIQWSISVAQPHSYSVSIPPDAQNWSMDEYTSFAFHLAKEWDPGAKMTSMGWLSTCDNVQVIRNQNILFTFVATKLHFGWPRMFHYSIDITPGTKSTEAVVMKILNKTWTRRLLDNTDVESMSVEFAKAFDVAQRTGGAEYQADHSTCYVRAGWQDGHWYFAYSSDRYGILNPFDVRVDGATGVVRQP